MLWLTVLLLTSAVQAADIEAMKAKLEAAMPVVVDSIKPLDDSGLYEVVVNGSDVLYFSEDLRYGFQGSVISLETGTNITENKKTDLRKNILASLDESELIIYEPDKTEYTVTVFTDIDCAYCRKLHNKRAEYNELGIRIRYMAFPRTGIDSKSFDGAEDVWCAEDRNQAMTDAKNGQQVNSKHCDSPVAEQYEMGRKLGVNGTPALFLESGESLPGYVSPKRLRQILDEHALAGS